MPLTITRRPNTGGRTGSDLIGPLGGGSCAWPHLFLRLRRDRIRRLSASTSANVRSGPPGSAPVRIDPNLAPANPPTPSGRTSTRPTRSGAGRCGIGAGVRNGIMRSSIPKKCHSDRTTKLAEFRRFIGPGRKGDPWLSGSHSTVPRVLGGSVLVACNGTFVEDEMRFDELEPT